MLYIANIRLPTEKAHGIQIMNMCEAFARAGERVTLIVPHKKNNIAEDPFAYYGVEPIFSIVRLGGTDLGTSAVGFRLGALLFAVRAFFYALSHSDGAVYSRDELPLLLLSITGKKTFFEVHTARSNFFVRAALQRVTGAVYISRGLEKFFSGTNGASHVATDAVDLEAFEHIPNNKTLLRTELGLPHERTIVGHVGKYTTMGKEKGVDSLIRTFPSALAANPALLLLLVGINEKERGLVEVVAQEAGIPQGALVVVPHLKHAQAIRYLKAADILVMNYPDTPHYRDFMSPLKLFEYMASGRAIVTSDLPSVREVLDDSTAVFFRPGDDAGLGRAIAALASNTSRLEQLGTNAAERARDYTWEARAKGILRFFSAHHA